jgi:hypothetical protein
MIAAAAYAAGGASALITYAGSKRGAEQRAALTFVQQLRLPDNRSRDNRP